MALDRENMDDAGIMQERIVKASKSAELFREIIGDLLENGNPQIRDEANYVLGKLDTGEVGIVCDDDIEIHDDMRGHYIAITQVVIGSKYLPTFVVSSGLNAPDIFDHIPKPAFLNIEPSREHMRPVVIEAVSQMAFALRAVEKFADGGSESE